LGIAITLLAFTCGLARADSFDERQALAKLRGAAPTPLPANTQRGSMSDTAWSDATTESARQAAWRRYYQERQDIADATARAFKDQAVQTWVIFVFVMLAAVVGLVAAVIQFWVGLRKADNAPATKLVVGPTSLELDSTSLAVVIFAMTGVLFFIFIRFVYPMTFVSAAGVPE